MTSKPFPYLADALAEAADVLTRVDTASLSGLVDDIVAVRRVFCAGVGRSGLWARAFAMRLAQAGVCAYVVGETVTPAIARDDLLLLVSGSGKTASLRSHADTARRRHAWLALLTYTPRSPLAELADRVACLPVPIDAARPGGVGGRQRLGGLFDQCALFALDAVAWAVADRVGADDRAMQDRHANLE